jgi:hypothetical protein
MLSKLISTNTIIHCIDDGTWDDVRSRIPEAYHADADLIANDIKAFNKAMHSMIQKTFVTVKNNYTKYDDSVADKKSFAIYVLKNHKDISHYLLNLYNGEENNFIKNKAGRYLRYYEIKKKLLLFKQK